MKGNQEQTNESEENNQDVKKNSELGNNSGVIRRDDEMEMEPPEILRLEFGEEVPTPFKKVLDNMRKEEL